MKKEALAAVAAIMLLLPACNKPAGEPAPMPTPDPAPTYSQASLVEYESPPHT